MRNINLIILILIVVTSVSCKKGEKEIERNSLISIIDEININKTTKWVVLLPGMGCNGCIQEGEAFLKRNIENKYIVFCLTKVESLKILQNKLGVTLRDHLNVYIDDENKLYFSSDNRIYPCIIQVENGKMIAYEFQSPNNGQAFENLESQILLSKK